MMPLKDKTILIMGLARFDGPFESTSFTTAKFLAQQNKVYYIDYPYTFKDFLKDKKKQTYQLRAKAISSADQSILDSNVPNLKVLILPFLLSINFVPESFVYRGLLKLNERLIIGRIKNMIKREKISDFIFINSFNFHYPGVAKAIRPTLSVYHCVDPLIVPYDRKHGLISEAQIVKEVDIVICTSKQLYQEKKKENSNTHFVPNAADLTHSSKALSPDCLVSEKLSSIPKPIIGYFGNIERRIDYPLLTEVAKQNPDKSFVFVGPVEEEYVSEEFKAIENIYFVGSVPYSEMPSVVKGFDIATIPFKKDEVSRTIFPLKLFEYLGAGKPVVATDFNPDLADFTYDTVAYCGTSQEFSKAITEGLNDKSQLVKQKRLVVARENTLVKRLSQFSGLLAEQLK